MPAAFKLARPAAHTSLELRRLLDARRSTGPFSGHEHVPRGWHRPFDRDRDDSAWTCPAPGARVTLSLRHLVGTLITEPERWQGCELDSAQIAQELHRSGQSGVDAQVLAVTCRTAVTSEDRELDVALACDPITVRCRALFGEAPFDAYGWEINQSAGVSIVSYAPSTRTQTTT